MSDTMLSLHYVSGKGEIVPRAIVSEVRPRPHSDLLNRLSGKGCKRAMFRGVGIRCARGCGIRSSGFKYGSAPAKCRARLAQLRQLAGDYQIIPPTTLPVMASMTTTTVKVVLLVVILIVHTGPSKPAGP